jgi:putative phosphoserine phosphatase/1-acylglycerol-3-phosphate O-acyltransferase
MDLRVTGEEHLWAQRPAVFVFNHQSKADVIIAAKLLRRDIAGIGKKEIKSENPLIGRVLEMGGVVLIDRANSKNAIEAITPLVDVMRNEGKSVVLAPEGTRTVSPRLAPFKKGAFHIAMQAGVPMVPIVIRNAGDVAPKGDFVFRPAMVEVEVLPPVDTSSWRPETVDEHVREVRNMFLRSLGQPEDKAPAGRKSPGKPKAGARKAAKKNAPARRKTSARKTTARKAAAKRKAPAKAKTAATRKSESAARSKTKSSPGRKAGKSSRK